MPSALSQSTIPRGRLRLWLALAVVAKLAVSIGLFPPLMALLGQATYQGGLFPDNYDLLASNLLAGHGYRMYEDTSLTMLRTPGFVWVLAGMFWLFGKSLFAVQVLQTFMTIATAGMTYSIALRTTASRTTAIVSALIVMFHPAVLVAETRGGIESSTLLVLTACVWAALRALESARTRDYLVFGLLFGAAMLVRSSVALLAPALAAIALWKRPNVEPLRHVFRNLVVAGLCTTVVVTPWVVRNYMVSGHFVPTMTVGGLAMFQGVHVVKNLDRGKQHSELIDEAEGEQVRVAREMNLRVRPEFFPQFYAPADEVTYYAELGRRAWRDLKASPALLGRTLGHNAWAFWFQGRSDRATRLNVLLTGPFVLLMLIGAFKLRSTRAAYLMVLGSITAFILPHLMIMGMARYHVPLIPLAAVFAAAPVAAVLRRLHTRLLTRAAANVT
jgi:4-amino-4-deoxy-L-arabinose transferase-like glycosyltransferase